MQLVAGEPDTPVLVADVKPNDYEHALTETSLYAAACVTLRHEDERCPLILGLPLTTAVASLHVYVIAHNMVETTHCVQHLPHHGPPYCAQCMQLCST